MSVLVKGMKMPEKCGSCDLFHAEYPMHCTVVKGHKTVGAPYGMPRPEWCPLVELPEKHGRLIDADALADDLEYDAQHFDDDHELKFNAAMWLRSNQNKVIVEAEGEG